MSSDDLKKYQDLQSEMTTRFVDFYNRNKDFIRAPAKNCAEDTRRMLREISKIAQEMKKLNQKIYADSVTAKRTQWAKEKADLAKGIKKPRKDYRKPKLAKGGDSER
jgi:hypothetical protein